MVWPGEVALIGAGLSGLCGLTVRFTPDAAAVTVRRFLAPVLLPPAAAVRSEENSSPYTAIVVWSGIGKCFNQYGVATPESDVETMMDLAKKQFGMEPYQVANIIKAASSDSDMDQYIKSEVGAGRSSMTTTTARRTGNRSLLPARPG